MKKLLSLVGLLLLCGVAHAEPIQFNLGKGVAFDVPFTQIDALALWNFKSKTGLAGAETPLITWKRFQFTGGAVTSAEGRGAPFVRTYLLLPNPMGNFAALESLRPGLFIGRDFNANQYMFGLAASLPIW